MQVDSTALPGVLILTPRRFGDARGWFSETWNREAARKAGLPVDWAQDNQSHSARTCTVRGLHYQRPPRAQAKLVRVTRGRILDVAVDVRRGSATYGQWVAVELSAEDGRQLLIPEGFLHGFDTREDGTDVIYKCSDVYAPDCDGAIHWADPDLRIDWGIAPEAAILSDKDRAAPPFAGWTSPFEATT